MRLLSEADVARLITPELAIGAAERAFALQAVGLGAPGRLHLRAATGGVLALAGFAADRLVIKANGHAATRPGPGV